MPLTETAQLLGNFGEFLGAIAVVVTLVYLATQLRQNTRAVEHATSRGVLEDANSWRYQLIENPEIAELYRTGMRDPNELSTTDRFRFRMLLEVLFQHWEHAFLSGAKHQITDAHIPGVLAQQGGARYWVRATASDSIFDSAFIEYIDSLGPADMRTQTLTDLA